jgi:hypothetical protein
MQPVGLCHIELVLIIIIIWIIFKPAEQENIIIDEDEDFRNTVPTFSTSSQLTHLNKVFHLPTPSTAPDLSGMKRSSRGALVQAEPNRRRQKLRESVFVTPLFPLNPPSHFIMLSNSGQKSLFSGLFRLHGLIIF